MKTIRDVKEATDLFNTFLDELGDATREHLEPDDYLEVLEDMRECLNEEIEAVSCDAENSRVANED